MWRFPVGMGVVLISAGALAGGCGGDVSGTSTGAGGGAASGTGGDGGSGGGGPVCTDGVKNGGETGIDCGGPACPKCATGDSCGTDTDCESGVCKGGLCQAASCTDGLQNGTETCNTAECNDSVKNGQETDVDCGGPVCAKCFDGQVCSSGSDCTSGVCFGGLCLPPSCMDAVQNGDETDVDCGGPTCPKCAQGQVCDVNNDCASGSCAGGVCQAPPPGKLVFVTSTTYDGNLGGVAGADAKCQARAVAASLAGTFKAWLSGPTLASSPSVRFTKATIPYRLVDGVAIAMDWADLTDGTILAPINKTEFGVLFQGMAYTFTLPNGTPGLFGSATSNCYGGDCHCNNWTNPNAQGTPLPGSAVGQTHVSNDDWSDYSFYNGCGGPHPLYCFEQ